MNSLPHNIRGIGVDMARIARFEEKAHDERFLQRVFTPVELEDAGDGQARAQRLAARWAAKEAAAKALGCGMGSELGWQDVAVLRDEKGAPRIALSERAREHHGNIQLMLSLSHEGEYAIALVLALQE